MPKDLLIAANLLDAFVTRNYERPPDDHPIYSLVGRVASDWAHLEHALDRVIWVLIGVTSFRAGAVTGQIMGAAPRCKAIISLLHERKILEPEFEKFIKRTDALMGKTFEVSDKRNRIVHDAWYLDRSHDSEIVAQFKSFPNRDPRFGIKQVDLAAIEMTLDQIKALFDKATALFIEVNDAVAARMRKTHRLGDGGGHGRKG